MTAPGAGETPQLHDCRVAFSEELLALAQEDERVVVVCNDSVGSSQLGRFAAELPGRLVDVGIAEQDLVGVAAGLANGGMLPVVCGAAPFLCARAFEQVKVDLVYSGRRVVVCAMSPGVAYGALGATHHAPEDLSLMRALPGLHLVVPADPAETRAALRWAVAQEGPSYVRIGRVRTPDLGARGAPFELTRVLRDGDDVTLVAIGSMVWRALQAADELAGRGVAARVLGVSVLEPLDLVPIRRAGEETAGIVTVEEAATSGGLGAAVAIDAARHGPVQMRVLGFADRFAGIGSAEELYEDFGLTPSGIAGAALELLASRCPAATTGVEPGSTGAVPG
ncbi:MAG TPA: transketolase C-terminal domain-containing protein [Acidimicrobiales bacterium]|nr:transketolase C-terminal domain-containing protein [Acidimicrobiales bacterium]